MYFLGYSLLASCVCFHIAHRDLQGGPQNPCWASHGKPTWAHESSWLCVVLMCTQQKHAKTKKKLKPKNLTQSKTHTNCSICSMSFLRKPSFCFSMFFMKPSHCAWIPPGEQSRVASCERPGRPTDGTVSKTEEVRMSIISKWPQATPKENPWMEIEDLNPNPSKPLQNGFSLKLWASFLILLYTFYSF